ncbi:hypothetical protein [Flavobacterium rhizosphaerae]|uniref:Uncharacterized protein n=1 Tax=Flavobacterium rhizosphaerae TaxID=3163298 RepID=A0ABW8YXP8_9FLAO
MTIFDQLAAYADKVNSPELVAFFQSFGPEKYVDAEFTNLLKRCVLELNAAGPVQNILPETKWIPIGSGAATVPVTKAYLVNIINSSSSYHFTVASNRAPYIIYALSGELQDVPGLPNPVLVATKKYSFFFLGGPGNWGAGIGYTQISENMLYELPVQNLQPGDIQPNDNTEITTLGIIAAGETLLSTLNSEAYDFTDDQKTYYFTYIVEDVLYLIQFIGINQQYGGTSGNAFVSSDFVTITDNTQPAAIESVQQYSSTAQFPETGLDNVLYIVKTLVNNIPGGKMYRWTGTGYAIMNEVNAEPPIQVGTAAQYWRGDKSWQTLNKAAVGLNNVNNTSDVAKPVSDATQAALNNKLNTGANASLTGGTVRVILATTDGTPIGEADISFNQITNNLTIGQDGISTGKLTVISNEFRLKVQNNIASGNAYVEFNADQEQALQFIDTNGVNYMTFKSLNGQQGIILLQRQVISRGVFFNLQWEQAAITTAGAGTKVYGKDSLGNDLSLTLDSNAQTIQASISFIVKNASGSEIIAGDFKPIVARIANNNLSISAYTVNITSNHSNAAYHDWAVGVEHIAGTNTIKFYFTPDADDNTNYTGAFTEIKYNIG